MAAFDEGRDHGFRERYDRDYGESGLRERFESSFRGHDPNDLEERRYGSRYDRELSGPFPHEGRPAGRSAARPRGAWGGSDRGMRSGAWGGGPAGYDRGYRGGGYDREYRHPAERHESRGYGADYGSAGYNRGLGENSWFGGGYGGRGYDVREYKSREQIDSGDPFGDRRNRTPIRMVNENFSARFPRRNAYDADVRRRDWF